MHARSSVGADRSLRHSSAVTAYKSSSSLARRSLFTQVSLVKSRQTRLETRLHRQPVHRQPGVAEPRPVRDSVALILVLSETVIQ